MPDQIRVMIVEPGGNIYQQQLPTGYPALNNALLGEGSLVQVLYGREQVSGDRVAVLFDEEGKYKNLKPNTTASLMWQVFLCDGARLMPGDYLSGRVAVCGVNNAGFTDVPDTVCPANADVQELNTDERSST